MTTQASPQIPEFKAPAPGTCPCGSGQKLEACCLPIIQGKRKAATAEQLLRARYTAFTRADVDFVLHSHHPDTAAEVKRDEIADWAKGSEWIGLQILQQEAGQEKDEQGTIIFRALYRDKTKATPDSEPPKSEEHWEQSYFKKDRGDWKFLDARGIQTGPYRRTEPKIGRNDPCTCGSGKKYKKCCAA